MSHFTESELARWSHEGPGTERQRVVSHLASCRACAEAYTTAMQNREQSPELAKAGEMSDFVEAGYRVPQGRGAKLTMPARVWIPLAAAAMLAIAVMTPRLLQRPEGNDAMAFRGTTIHTLAPQGAVASAAEFNWSSPYAAAKFKIEVGDSSGVISSGESSQPKWTAPSELRAQLQPGHEYWWTVSAIDASGREILKSARQSFTIQP